MPDDLPRWKRYFHSLVAAEISSMTRHYDAVVQWARRGGDTGYLLSRVEAGEVSATPNDEPLPDFSGDRRRVAVLLNGTLNYHLDVEELLHSIKPKLARTSRLIIVAYNPYLQWLYRLAIALNLKAGGMPTTYLTVTDFDNLCRLAGYQRIRMRPAGYVPWRLLGLGSLVNRLMPAVPLLRYLSIATVIVLRPLVVEKERASVSVIIPARNERGNIEPAIQRLPDLGSDVEIVFVEGHSSDGTWEEILRVRDAYAATHRIVALQQSGKGKADAVRVGFEQATGDLLTILDADLTMPPELLPRFVDAYRNGVADFINGSRIVYPMEGGAMRFLNRLGNIFFAKALTWVLGVRLGDCLCGTKLVRRDDYARMVAWRGHFGDFDPFGDFELLFPAAILGIGLVDVPIRYRARTYGSTQISRFRHGFMLLKMTLIGFFRVKLGQIPRRS